MAAALSIRPAGYELGENTTMKIDEIKLLCDYNGWADAQMLAACAKVSPEQYAAPASYGRGGLRATMVHILDNIWQQRITLQEYYQEPLADEAAYDATELHEDAFPTLSAMSFRVRCANVSCGTSCWISSSMPHSTVARSPRC